MWVSNRILDLFRGELFAKLATERQVTSLQAERSGLQHIIAQLREQKVRDNTMIEWLTARVNALEMERVVLMREVGHIALPTPQLQTTKPAVPQLPDEDDFKQFDDMGEDAARAAGIQHDTDGYLVYTK